MAHRKIKSFQEPEKVEKKIAQKNSRSGDRIREDDNRAGLAQLEVLSCENKPELYLRLQQTYGNRYLQEMAKSTAMQSPAGGLIEGNIEDEEIFLGGNTPDALGGEWDDNPYEEDDNPYRDEESSDETETNVSISANNKFGPLWEDNGRFDWAVTFSTTGGEGWIIQEIVNTFSARDVNDKDLVGNDIDPHYWEAWYVDESGTVSPEENSHNDYWVRPTRDDGSSGIWSMEGNVFFTRTFDPTMMNFLPGAVDNAGILLSTTREPEGLGSALLSRNASGIWEISGEHAGDAS
ncbi:MAG: hypothetical protein A2Z02_06735 [Chloroflexi bacterium RBG_16_48_7]|nr:MAG: hypothetical protein A2Z02_06735 [Chloroflexi bacterium RBG_16_48_7]